MSHEYQRPPIDDPPCFFLVFRENHEPVKFTRTSVVKLVVLRTINKEHNSPSFRCVHCPKVEIFVEKHSAKNYIEPRGSRHVGGPPQRPFTQAIFVAAARCNFCSSKIASSFKHVQYPRDIAATNRTENCTWFTRAILNHFEVTTLARQKLHRVAATKIAAP